MITHEGFDGFGLNWYGQVSVSFIQYGVAGGATVDVHLNFTVLHAHGTHVRHDVIHTLRQLF